MPDIVSLFYAVLRLFVRERCDNCALYSRAAFRCVFLPMRIFEFHVMIGAAASVPMRIFADAYF